MPPVDTFPQDTREEPAEKYIDCPVCGGAGFIHQARSISTGKVVNVTLMEFLSLAEDEDEARKRGDGLCADSEFQCPVCDGWGYIEK